jgi:hypothetical protein
MVLEAGIQTHPFVHHVVEIACDLDRRFSLKNHLEHGGKVAGYSSRASSAIRSMELLLGLPPMSQYDAAATPMYKSFGDTADLSTF